LLAVFHGKKPKPNSKKVSKITKHLNLKTPQGAKQWGVFLFVASLAFSFNVCVGTFNASATCITTTQSIATAQTAPVALNETVTATTDGQTVTSTPVIVQDTCGGDDVSYQVALPTAINFQGTNYTAVYATTNSTIVFGTQDNNYSNFPNRPSISVNAYDWVVLDPANPNPSNSYPVGWRAPDEHLIISSSQAGFQVDLAVRPYGQNASANPLSTIVVTAAINADNTLTITYLSDVQQGLNTRTGVRLPDGRIVTLEEAGLTRVYIAPVVTAETIEPAPTPSPSISPSASPSPSPSLSPQPSPTPQPTSTPTPTPTPSQTPTPTPSQTTEPTPTPTPSPTPLPSTSNEPNPSPSPSVTPQVSPSPTSTPTPEPLPQVTPTPTPTPSVPSPILSPTPQPEPATTPSLPQPPVTPSPAVEPTPQPAIEPSPIPNPIPTPEPALEPSPIPIAPVPIEPLPVVEPLLPVEEPAPIEPLTQEPLPVEVAPEPPIVEPLPDTTPVEAPVEVEPPIAIPDPVDAIGQPPVEEIEPPTPVELSPSEALSDALQDGKITEADIEAVVGSLMADGKVTQAEATALIETLSDSGPLSNAEENLIIQALSADGQVTQAEVNNLSKTLASDGTFTTAEKELVADALIVSAEGQAVTAEAIHEAGIDYADLPDTQPVEVRQDENGNEVIISAVVADALELLASPAEMLVAIFESPAQLIFALGNLGADMSVAEREEATKTVVAATIVGNIAATTVAASAVGAASYRRKP